MSGRYSCERCGSAGSVEFGMCQVCLHDYTQAERGFLRPRLRLSRWELREEDLMDMRDGVEREAKVAV